MVNIRFILYKYIYVYDNFIWWYRNSGKGRAEMPLKMWKYDSMRNGWNYEVKKVEISQNEKVTCQWIEVHNGWHYNNIVCFFLTTSKP